MKDYESQHQKVTALQVAEKERAEVTIEADHGESTLRLIASLNSHDFQRFADIKKLEGFPVALRAMVLFLTDHPSNNGLTQEAIIREFGAPLQIVEYPVTNIYWRTGDALCRARLQYMDDEERQRKVDPTKIDLDVFDASDMPTDVSLAISQMKADPIFNYEFDYKQLPHQTKEAGSFSGSFYPTDESFYVNTHWGRTSIISGGQEEDTPSPQITSERVARLTKFAAKTMIDRYDEVNKPPLLE